MTGLLPLGEDEVHVWYLRTDAAGEPFAAACAALLSAEEQERWRRFASAEARRLYVLSHGFLRRILSRYAPVAPGDWRFVRNASGKPIVDTPAALSFNLTHTAGLAACAVAWRHDIGIDAEELTRRGQAVSSELVQRCLSREEHASLLRLPHAQRQAAFFDYWTLKEAYLKARGLGLYLPIDAISFRWPKGEEHCGEASVAFSPAIDDDPSQWQFASVQPTPTHVLSLAVRRMRRAELRVAVREYRDTDTLTFS